MVCTAYSIFSHLIAFFNDILHSPQSWDDDTVDATGGYVSKLQNTEFVFLLEVFQNIFPHTELLFNILETKRYDSSHCNAKVENVKGIIASLRSDKEFNNMWQKSSASIDDPRRKRAPFDNEPFKLIFLGTLDHLLQ